MDINKYVNANQAVNQDPIEDNHDSSTDDDVICLCVIPKNNNFEVITFGDDIKIEEEIDINVKLDEVEKKEDSMIQILDPEKIKKEKMDDSMKLDEVEKKEDSMIQILDPEKIKKEKMDDSMKLDEVEKKEDSMIQILDPEKIKKEKMDDSMKK